MIAKNDAMLKIVEILLTASTKQTKCVQMTQDMWTTNNVVMHVAKE